MRRGCWLILQQLVPVFGDVLERGVWVVLVATASKTLSHRTKPQDQGLHGTREGESRVKLTDLCVLARHLLERASPFCVRHRHGGLVAKASAS